MTPANRHPCALMMGGILMLTTPQAPTARNPILHADVPDPSVIRVGEIYYLASTTMHLSPGLPILKSRDLVNWDIVGYAYDTLADHEALNLQNGKNAYGGGSWASSLRFHKGVYSLITFSHTTGRTYIYRTRDIERGPWTVHSFSPALHDPTLFFDDDGRVYLIHGAGRLRLVELNEDLSGPKPRGLDRVILDNASAPAGPSIGLPAEGSQLFKVRGKYYLFNIAWPRGGMRMAIVHRADSITGPYEGRIALQDQGVAQGGLIDTPGGEWYACLFRDYGAVGRVPYLVPVRWNEEWPELGVNGKVPETLNLPPNKGVIPGLVASDTFDRQPGDPALPPVWQWNHNPDSRFWSVRARPGFLRLTTGRVDPDFLQARNTLTQRTFGPQCSARVSLDVSAMKDGDCAGLALLQKHYGYIGVTAEAADRYVVMVRSPSGTPTEERRALLNTGRVFLKAEADFRDRRDTARFFYSLDGRSWSALGPPLKMTYTLPHFMGYRFALFNFARRAPGGHVDFDEFLVNDRITEPPEGKGS